MMTAGTRLRLWGAAALLSALLACALEAEAAATGRCVAVKDGDSIVVAQRGGGEIEIRLHGIDAPEKDQPWADRARQSLADLVLDRDVRAVGEERDAYGRLLARVFVGDLDINLEQVRRGLAWHYERYSRDRALAIAQSRARAEGAGLWADPSPIPPWTFRSEARSRETATSGGRAASSRSASATVAEGEVHGNTSSRVYHRASCPNFDCRRCTARFPSAAAAEAAGYHASGDCHR